nr:PAS domain-containing sensor histidine kinase [Haloplanus sp. XH21]
MPLVSAFWVSAGFLAAGTVSLYFLTLHTVHGHVVEAAWFLVYDVAATGSIGGLLISRYDLRARRRNERLSRRERQFRAVFEGTLDALVITDGDGEYVAANPAAADLFGLPREELIGKHVADFATRDADIGTTWEAFLADGKQRGEFRLHRPDGEVRTVAFAATANVLPGHHLSALRDVTERTERERELAEERARIEFLNQLLRHNILNGMNLVLAKLDAVDAALPPEADDDLTVARHRGEEIVDLVQTARRLATDAPAATERRVDLIAPVSEAVEAVRRTDPEATIRFSPPAEAVFVRADDMIGTIFDHLLTNTVEHNDTASLTVTVDVTVDAETVTVTVADDGVGISAERREELFGDSGFVHTRSWGGFGLSIVDALVDEYDGRVWVEANEPTGVVFVVELPRAAE